LAGPRLPRLPGWRFCSLDRIVAQSDDPYDLQLANRVGTHVSTACHLVMFSAPSVADFLVRMRPQKLPAL